MIWDGLDASPFAAGVNAMFVFGGFVGLPLATKLNCWL
jgi:hypothetical protein